MLALRGLTTPVTRLAFSPDGGTLAGLGQDGAVRLWPASGGERALGPLPKRVRAIAFSGDGSTLLLGGDGGHLLGLTLNDPTADAVKLSHGYSAISAVQGLSRHGAVAVGSGVVGSEQAGAVQFHCPARPRAFPNLTELRGVWAMAYHPEPQTLAWTTGSRELVLWDLSRPAPLRVRLAAGSSALALSPDGRSVAAADGYAVRVFDTATRQERFRIAAGAAVKGVGYHPAGGVLATACLDGSVRVWDAATGRERLHLKTDGALGRTHSLAFSPDGMRAAVGGGDGTVLLWDTDFLA